MCVCEGTGSSTELLMVPSVMPGVFQNTALCAFPTARKL